MKAYQYKSAKTALENAEKATSEEMIEKFAKMAYADMVDVFNAYNEGDFVATDEQEKEMSTWQNRIAALIN